jgi:hydrogenase maturation factor
VSQIFRDIDRSARGLGIAVTGGHTEISTAVTQPIVAGDMQGVMRREALVTSAGARIGDVVIMTKFAGIEGTAIIARRLAREARELLGARSQREAARFHHRPGISVVTDALLAAHAGATAMHDPTEGGVAAALFELATASGKGLAVDLDRIPVHPYTAHLCAHLRLRPLGLIGSGALLLTIPERHAGALLRAFGRRRIPATVIGAVRAGRGVAAYRGGRRVRFDWSQRDELTRLEQAPADGFGGVQRPGQVPASAVDGVESSWVRAVSALGHRLHTAHRGPRLTP